MSRTERFMGCRLFSLEFFRESPELVAASLMNQPASVTLRAVESRAVRAIGASK